MRSVGTVPAADFGSEVVYPYRFFRFSFPSPGTTIFYTTKPGGFIGDIDGTGSHPWIEYACDMLSFTEGRDSASQVSALTIGNAKQEWTALEANPGLADVQVDIWIGRFDAAGNLKGSYRRTRGVLGAYDLADVLQVEVVPESAAWVTQVPIEMGAACSAPFKHPELCGYVGADTTCQRTIDACTLKGNQANFLGLVLGLPAGTDISWNGFKGKLPSGQRLQLPHFGDGTFTSGFQWLR